MRAAIYCGRGCLRYGTEVLDLERREANIHLRPWTFCAVAHITHKEIASFVRLRT